MAEEKVYLNGSIVPASEALLSAWDAGFLHGASVFTTMLAHNGAVFRLDRHLARLMETVSLLGIGAGATAESLSAATASLLAANGLQEARVRITLTPGSVRDEQGTVLITAEALPGYPPQWYEKGIPVIVSSFRQGGSAATFGFKTGCYLPRVLARREAAEKGAEEAIWFTDDNRLAEACFCNVFLVLRGGVRTPPLDTPVLPGVVRGAVLELCRQLDIECESAKPLTVKDMLAADEMFLTASCSGIRAVVSVERHVVGDGEVGAVTGRIMAAYRELLDRECPAPGGSEQ